MATDALITQTLPSLINGVSQQPANVRLGSQCESQVNVVSDVADGAVWRPPSKHIALLAGPVAGVPPTGEYFFHEIDRGDGQQFQVIIEDGDINVYNLTTGAEVTVTDAATGAPGTYNYLNITPSVTVDAKNSFEAVTIADYTFILNKRISTALSVTAGTARTQAHEFILYISGVNAVNNQNFVALKLGATLVDISAAVGLTSTKLIADAICTAVCGVAAPNVTTGTLAGEPLDWRFTRVSDNVIYGYQFQGTLDAVTCSDPTGDTIHELLATTTAGGVPKIPLFSSLPKIGVDAFVVQVKGDDGSSEDEFYVKYSSTDKLWVETVAPSLYNSFNADTMPHALTYSGGSFTFGPIAWASRTVGDTTSAPPPSFVTKTIKDLFLHKNRLFFLSDENAIASESGDFFDFWPSTVTTLVDSDTFDIAGTGSRISTWDYGLPFQGNVVLFSSTGDMVAEIVGSRDEPLTVKNARIEERGAWPLSAVRPVALDNLLYIVRDQGTHSVAYQFSLPDIALFQNDEITGHVKQYLPADIIKMAAGRDKKFIVFLNASSGYEYQLHVYRTHFVGSEQVMSSFSLWEFDPDCRILNIGWLGSILYLCIYRQDGLHLEKIDFGVDQEAPSGGAYPLDYRVHLDSLVDVTGVYSTGTGLTTWTLPYDQFTNLGTYRCVKTGSWGASKGNEIAITNAVDLSVTAVGDYSAHAVFIGRQYTKTYELSEIVMRETSATSKRGARISGRLQLRKGRVIYKDTGAFDVQIRSRDDSDVWTDSFTSSFLNQVVIGTSSLDDGIFEFHIGGDARSVRIIFTSTSYFPAKLTSFEWEGKFFQRSVQA